LGELSASDRPGRGRPEVVAAALDGLVVHVRRDHLQPAAGEHLGDARAHRAQADHADRPELPHVPTSHCLEGPRSSHPDTVPGL
jgi:hypothetical protein